MVSSRKKVKRQTHKDIRSLVCCRFEEGIASYIHIELVVSSRKKVNRYMLICGLPDDEEITTRSRAVSSIGRASDS